MILFATLKGVVRSSVKKIRPVRGRKCTARKPAGAKATRLGDERCWTRRVAGKWTNIRSRNLRIQIYWQVKWFWIISMIHSSLPIYFVFCRMNLKKVNKSRCVQNSKEAKKTDFSRRTDWINPVVFRIRTYPYHSSLSSL